MEPPSRARSSFAAALLSFAVAGCGARTQFIDRSSPTQAPPDSSVFADGSTSADVVITQPDVVITQPDVMIAQPDVVIAQPDVVTPARVANQLDMLVVIDNSGSMTDVQANLIVDFQVLLETLQNPLCGSRSNPAAEPHACTGSADDVMLHQPLRDLHLGVVSTDLGTAGTTIPGCDDAANGDNGRLNPLRYGPALQNHLPWAPRRPTAQTAPAGFRPDACGTSTDRFPAFITFCSNTADPSCDLPDANASTRDPATFALWFRCNAGLFVNGCGLESQLESAWRALVENGASAPSGTPNAGFLRDDAVLAIVVITDEEDGSVRQCAHDLGFSMTRGQRCIDASAVYDTNSPNWAHPTNPDLRFYLYTPADTRDPTWALDRYADTTGHWNRDFWSLKPDHPERVVFAAITGVPLAVPTLAGQTDYDALLGTPRNGVDDFFMRESSASVSGNQGAAGPFSMRQANMDPMCSHVVPACRREGSTYDPTRPCSNTQAMAFPSRRIVEVARRFEQSPHCAGSPCNNGYVSSICASDLEPALRAIGRKIARRL